MPKGCYDHKPVVLRVFVRGHGCLVEGRDRMKTRVEAESWSTQTMSQLGTGDFSLFQCSVFLFLQLFPTLLVHPKYLEILYNTNGPHP